MYPSYPGSCILENLGLVAWSQAAAARILAALTHATLA